MLRRTHAAEPALVVGVLGGARRLAFLLLIPLSGLPLDFFLLFGGEPRSDGGGTGSTHAPRRHRARLGTAGGEGTSGRFVNGDGGQVRVNEQAAARGFTTFLRTAIFKVGGHSLQGQLGYAELPGVVAAVIAGDAFFNKAVRGGVPVRELLSGYQIRGPVPHPLFGCVFCGR